MRYDRFRHHRRSIRMKGWDYTRPGVYYVTICTKGQIHLFGDVRDGRMHLNIFGRIIEDAWQALEWNYVYVRLDEYQVMPNHLHGIVIYKRMADIAGMGGSRTARTSSQITRTSSQTMHTYGIRTLPDNKSLRRKPFGRLIGAYKTNTTHKINIIRDTPGNKIWQRDMYERVVRARNELHRIRKYIRNNPRNWDGDEFNV